MATQVQKKDVEGMWWKVEKGKVTKPIVPLTQEQKDARNERFEKAYDEAVNIIFAGVNEKIKVAETEGKHQVIVYTFSFAKDPKAVNDENGVQVVFGDRVRLMDILVKGYSRFIGKSLKVVNVDGRKKYGVGYFKKSNEENEKDVEWNICVTWRPFIKKVYKKDSDVKKVPFKKNVLKYNNKKGGDGFMMETKLVKKVVDMKMPNPNSWAGKVVASLA